MHEAEEIIESGYPCVAALIDGTPVGYAQLRRYRPEDGFAFTAEAEIYLDKTARRKQIGSHLGLHLLKHRLTRARQVHCLHGQLISMPVCSADMSTGVVTANNAGGISLCLKAEFRNLGLFHDVFFKG